MLSMLFETGHPWITFKDACNLRSSAAARRTIHSSNLCTEITLNTSASEIAVCNLGSVNMPAHMKPDGKGGFELDQAKLKKTIRTAMRMLDNVIDINYYAVPKAPQSNARHRPVGLGIIGLPGLPAHDADAVRVRAAVEFSDRSMEAVLLPRLLGVDGTGRGARTLLVLQRVAVGPRDPSAGQPEDLASSAALRRGRHELDDGLGSPAHRIRQHGMRNSNCVAIAPTATISNIIGVDACIEPTFQNLFVKSNLSGEFTVVERTSWCATSSGRLWDEVMVADLKYFDGSLARNRPHSRRAPPVVCDGVRVEPGWLIECAGAPAEVDRPGPVPQHLHGWRLRRSSTRPTGSPGCAASRRPTTCAHRATHAEKSTTPHRAAQLGPTAAARRGATAMPNPRARPACSSRRSGSRTAKPASNETRRSKNMLAWDDTPTSHPCSPDDRLGSL